MKIKKTCLAHGLYTHTHTGVDGIWSMTYIVYRLWYIVKPAATDFFLTTLFSRFLYLFCYLHMCSCMDLCSSCACRSQRGQNKASEPQALELQVAVRKYVGAGNWIWVIWKSLASTCKHWVSTTTHFSDPNNFILHTKDSHLGKLEKNPGPCAVLGKHSNTKLQPQPWPQFFYSLTGLLDLVLNLRPSCSALQIARVKDLYHLAQLKHASLKGTVHWGLVSMHSCSTITTIYFGAPERNLALWIAIVCFLSNLSFLCHNPVLSSH